MAAGFRMVLTWIALCCSAVAWAQGAAGPATAPAADGTPRLGADQPAALVPAHSDAVTVRVLLRDLDAPPTSADLEAGLLVSARQPNLLQRPAIQVLGAHAAPAPAAPKDQLVTLRVSGLLAFGETSVPLLYRGRVVETLRFSRPGLIVKPAVDGGFVARGGSPLALVLENPLPQGYRAVRARLRFGQADVCHFVPERFAAGTATAAPAQSPSCSDDAHWTRFDMPRQAQVTLQARPADDWFLDPASGRARAGKQTGWLTLRFDADGVVHEQNLPVEIDFQPGTWTLFLSLLQVGGLLLAGAVLSLVLRVSVPNIKQKRQLKDRLAEAAKLTAAISTEVDSTLRVLLRVERLALDEIRRAAWAFGPSYADYARRVADGIGPLMRRIDAARRLDATLVRRRLLLEQAASPTRLAQIEDQLAAVSETLKQDRLSDEDWVFVTQRLEAAQKTLREPTQTEKEAFDAMLSGRWKAIRTHFGLDADQQLQRPAVLGRLGACFPDKRLLPLPSDEDGSQWIQAVGAVRADLQLSALALLWEFQFLAPAEVAVDSPWATAQERLRPLLATPAVDNLREARLLLRQLAEDVTEADIVAALKSGGAAIVMDPALPRPNQKIRFAVRFRVARFNSAAARGQVTCRWRFRDRHATALESATTRVRTLVGLDDAAGRQADEPDCLELGEDGWSVHHYFEGDVDQSTIDVRFFDAAGQPIDIGCDAADPTALHWSRRTESVRRSRRSKEAWAHAWLEAFQLSAALLIPLATLASTTLGGNGGAHWWEVIAIGFASDTVKSILVGRPEPPPAT